MEKEGRVNILKVAGISALAVFLAWDAYVFLDQDSQSSLQNTPIPSVTPTPTELPEIQQSRQTTGNDELLKRAPFDQKTTP